MPPTNYFSDFKLYYSIIEDHLGLFDGFAFADLDNTQPHGHHMRAYVKWKKGS